MSRAFLILSVLAGLAPLARADDLAPAAPPHVEIAVPVDHFDPASGDFDLHVEFAAPFDPSLPTLLLIHDGQQFFVRPGHVKALRDRLLDADAGINVVGIVGRGSPHRSHPALEAAVVDSSGRTDWPAVHRVFRVEQWIEDIDAVRRDLVGDDGRVMLWGRSGGGALVHEYMAAHPHAVSRAFTSAAALSPLARFAGVRLDRFWREIGAADPSAHDRIRTLLRREDLDRDRLAMALQRQNFFVSVAERDSSRLALLEAFAERDTTELARVLEAYQVETVRAMNAAPIGRPIRARLLEFLQPWLDVPVGGPDRLDPDLEVLHQAAAPLLPFVSNGTITPRPLDRSRLHEVEAEVFVLAGRFDHVVDYRGQIALAASYPRSTLFLAHEGHTFDRLVAADLYRPLLTTFLRHGSGSPEMRAMLTDLEEFRWSED